MTPGRFEGGTAWLGPLSDGEGILGSKTERSRVLDGQLDGVGDLFSELGLPLPVVSPAANETGLCDRPPLELGVRR